MYSTAKKSFGEQAYNCISKMVYDAKAHKIKPYQMIQSTYWENIIQPKTRPEEQNTYHPLSNTGIYSKKNDIISKYGKVNYKL